MYNHSPERIFKKFLLPSILFALLVISPALAHAQMFSVDDTDDAGPSIAPGIGIYVGWEPIDFSYQGDDNVPTANYLVFSGSLLRFKLETSALTFYLGTGVAGLDDASYFDAGIRAGYGLELYHKKGFTLQLPLQLHTSYTSVSNDRIASRTVPDFQQGTLEIATGLQLYLRASSQIRFRLTALPSYGFSFSTGERNAGGSIAALEGQFRVFFDQLFGTTGLSIGYDYGYRKYDLKEERLDYNAITHSFLIGVTF